MVNRQDSIWLEAERIEELKKAKPFMELKISMRALRKWILNI